MQYRLDQKSGNKLSVLGFGCMRLPGAMGRIDLQKSEALIMDAISKGVNFFDTAYLYPGSEAALGSVLDKNKLRAQVYVATKLPLFKCHSADDFDRLFGEQLKRLKTTYIDYYFMHNICTFADWQRLCGLGIEQWIADKKAAGQIKQAGFSFHGAREDFFKVTDAYDWDFCMIQYNYINTHFQAGAAGLRYASAKGMPVFIMEPLLGGRLVKDLPEKAVTLLKQNSPEVSPAAWALRWVWNQPEVTLLLSGMSEPAQVAENTALAAQSKAGGMTAEELAVIAQVADVFSASYKIPCTGCNYCLPCPKNINIPDSFMAYNASYSIGRVAGLKQYATTTGGFTPSFSAANCIQCGKCEARCPQHIAIAARLSDVRKRLEPFWYRVALAMVRKVMSRH